MYGIVYLPLNVRYCLQMGERGIVLHASQVVYSCLQAAASHPIHYPYQAALSSRKGLPANLIFLFNFTFKQDQAAAKSCIFTHFVI